LAIIAGMLYSGCFDRYAIPSKYARGSQWWSFAKKHTSCSLTSHVLWMGRSFSKLHSVDAYPKGLYYGPPRVSMDESRDLRRNDRRPAGLSLFSALWLPNGTRLGCFFADSSYVIGNGDAVLVCLYLRLLQKTPISGCSHKATI